MTKGLASFSLPKYNNMIAAVIDPEKALNLPSMKMETFQFFGIEDSILNHAEVLIADKKGDLDNIHIKSDTLLSKRKFQVSCIKEAECLHLDNETIDKMKRDYPKVSSNFYKEQITQFMLVYKYHDYCTQQYHLEQWQSPVKMFTRQSTRDLS